MHVPVLHVIAGPNGAGKTSLYESTLALWSSLEFVNADRIAVERWPGCELEHGYEASRLAAHRRDELSTHRKSFVTETVFSHESKVDLIHGALSIGYVVTLHVVVVPEDLAVARVRNRVELGGHDVPEEKIRDRHRRLWHHVAEAIEVCDSTYIYDNSSASTPFREIAAFRRGKIVQRSSWPGWMPSELVNLCP